MNHQPNTEAGPKYNLNDFMRVSIALKSEMDERSLPRYTYIQKITAPLQPRESPTTSPHTDVKSTPTILATPRTPGPSNPPTTNGTTSSDKEIDVGRPVTPPPDFLLVAATEDVTMMSASPTSPTSPSEAVNPDDPSQITSVVRFVLDASRARDEKLTIAPYYDIVEKEITEERDLWVPKISPSAKRAQERAITPPRDRDRERERGRGGDERDRDGDRRNTRTYTPPPSSTTRAPFLKHPAPNDRDRRADSPPSRRTSPPPRNRDDRNRRDYSPQPNNSRNSGGRWENSDRNNRDRSPANGGRGGSYRRGNERERERERSRDRSPKRDDRERDRGSYRREERNGSERGRYYRD
jgi:hypothetical protein